MALLKAAGRWTRAGTEVTLVSDAPHLLYSGMTPEHLGGLYGLSEVRVDLAAWCRKNRVRFVASPAVGLEPGRRVVRTADGGEFACDAAVFNLGATNPLQDRAGESVLTKPLRHIERLGRWLDDVLARPQPRRSLVVVGGGPAGTEVMLNVSARLRRSRRPDALRLTLVHPGERLLPGFAPGMGRRAERLLRSRGVDLRLGRGVARVEASAVVLGGGERVDQDVGQHIDQDIDQDMVLWATGSTGQPLFRDAGLPVSEAGFLCVGRDLRCPAAPWLFAAGDCAEVAGLALDRSGVNAVKEGETLRRNVDRLVRAAQRGGDPAGVRLERFRPYPVSPYLVSTGGPEALLALGPRVWARGRALLWLKHRVDRRWIARYRRGV